MNAEWVTDDAISSGTTSYTTTDDEALQHYHGLEAQDGDEQDGDEHEDEWLRWVNVSALLGATTTVPTRNAYGWNGQHYLPVFFIRPGEREPEQDLYGRWKVFEDYFGPSPDLWFALQVDPMGYMGHHYRYEGPYVTAEHRRAMKSLVIEKAGCQLFQVLTAIMPPTATLSSVEHGDDVVAWRVDGGSLVYNRCILDGRNGDPTPEYNPASTYTSWLTQAMRESMAPFNA